MKSHTDFARLVRALSGIGIFSNRPMFDREEPSFGRVSLAKHPL